MSCSELNCEQCGHVKVVLNAENNGGWYDIFFCWIFGKITELEMGFGVTELHCVRTGSYWESWCGG